MSRRQMSRRQEFFDARETGYADVVKLLLPHLNENDIKSEDNYAFRYACQNGYIEVVKLLLPYLSREDIKSKYNFAFRWACIMGI